jgi:NAD-dependent dihydropyrimidine dehydrogenase PreA subunit
MKVVRKIVQIDEEKCDGCGLCVPSCAEGSLEIVDGKARVIADKLCDGLGACLGECPQGALKIIEREADEFDEEAVEAHLKTHASQAADAPGLSGSGCPSVHIMNFAPAAADSGTPSGDVEPSGLSHWPVQISLVPAKAPFLKNADLLVAADCVPVAFPSFHRDMLAGKAVMLGCPKLDNAERYVHKFTEIFKQAGIRSVTAVVMEVPCCAGLPAIVKKAMADAGVSINLEEVVVSTRGQILERRTLVAL